MILCFVLIINSFSVAYGAELMEDFNEVRLYFVPVKSNEYLEGVVTFYEFDKKYYLNLEDVMEFTRSTFTEDEETITLTHGLREIVIDKSTGHMIDLDIVDQGNIILLKYDGKYLCEGIPMLIYLGATCTINEHKELEVFMPAFTIWESIMPDYLDYYFNISELYGGEDNVKISLICDIIADILDGVSGHGLMVNADTHLEDALYEILNVDMMKYASVQEIASVQNQKINDFLSSAIFGMILDTGDNMYDVVYEVLDYYSRFYISTRNDILLDMMIQTDNLDYASELASQIKKQVYVQSAIKANLKNAKKVQSFMDIGMLAFDTAVIFYSMMQYNDDTKNLFSRTINQEMFEYVDYYDISWNNVSNKISNTLKSTQSIVANTVINNVTEFVVEEVTEEGAKMALSAFTSKTNIYTMAIQIGSFIASLLNYESNQAFSADMNAIWLSAVQYDVAMLVSSLLAKEHDGFQFSSVESLEKLKNMFTLYYRITIAFSENIAKSIEEFGTNSNQKWISWFSSTTEASVGNYVAAYLYRITNCEIVPIIDFSEISDEIITYDWISNVKVDYSNFVTDAYCEEFGGRKFNIPKINLSSDAVANINAEIWTKLYDGTVVEILKWWNQEHSEGDEYITYNWYVNYNILSLVVESYPMDWVWWNYYVYNISVSTGDKISNNEIISMAGLSQEEYLDIVRQALGSAYFQDKESYIEREGYDNFFRTQLEKTLSESNIQSCVPYFNENGQLCIIGAVYSLIEADFYYHEINLESFVSNPAFSEYMKIQANAANSNSFTEQYKAVLSQHPEFTPHTYGSNTFYCDTQYTVYDIDKNGIPELIVREDLSGYYIYSFNGTDVVSSDMCYWSYSDCLYEYEGNGIVIHDGGMGSMRIENASLYSMVNNKLAWSEELMSTEDGSFDELYSFLDSLIPIDDFLPITDYSHLSN